jgi:hypothetical protein
MQPTELVSISCESARVRSQELADLERSRANEPRIADEAPPQGLSDVSTPGGRTESVGILKQIPVVFGS